MSQLDVARAALHAVEARVGARSPELENAGQAELAGDAGILLDAGRFPRGATSCVIGSNTLLLAALAADMSAAHDAWTAIIGMPTLGIVAGSELGLDLGRIALVPEPGEAVEDVAAALIDGIDIVVLGPRAPVAPTARRPLQARARARGGALVVVDERWSTAGLVLDVTARRWSGTDEGRGWLQDVELEVTRTGREGAPRRWSATRGHGGGAWVVARPSVRAAVRVA